MGTGAKLGSMAVVAGAGIGGLTAAAALSPFFAQVVVYEKDRLPAGPQPRRGVAQGHHVHVFLVGGLASLEELLPGILGELHAAGAQPVDLGADLDLFDHGHVRPRRRLGLVLLCLSRPAYEQVVRQRVAALPNVRIECGTRVAAVALADGRAAGLVLAGHGVAEADFVVDATGRGASLAAQLAAEGHGSVPETVIGIDMCYVSGRFRLPDSWNGSAAAMCVPGPPDRRYGVLLPVEDGECVVSLGGRGSVEPATSFEGFLAYARRLASPAIIDRIAGAELLGPIQRHRMPSAGWRHYERLARFPARLAPIGDTIASFNPIWGQGMTVAVRHALALRRSLRRAGPGDGFAADYLPAAAAASEQAWNSAAPLDLSYREVIGERPPDFERALAFLRGLRRVADEDPEVHLLWSEVAQMVRSPAALGEHGVAAKVAAALAGAGAQQTILANPLLS